jgi:endonuclease YncB( thermonuclease family)
LRKPLPNNLLLFLFALVLALPNLSLADTLNVTRVIDGDTLKVVSESNQKQTIRLVGIDAPSEICVIFLRSPCG